MSAVILLTGASRGIGLEIAKELAIGNRIVALSRTITPELKKLESPTLLLVQGDVTDDIAVDKVISTALEKWGKIDSLVLNAGTLDPLVSLTYSLQSNG